MNIEKESFYQEGYMLNIMGKKIPISEIKLGVEVILMMMLVYWAFFQGIQIQQENMKMTAFLCNNGVIDSNGLRVKCTPIQDGDSIKMDCSTEQVMSFNFTTG